jgi:hypothetical protein
MDIIADYAARKTRATEMCEYVSHLRDPRRKDIERVYTNLKLCASYLVFNDYFTVEQLKLVKAHTCKQHLLCPFCAARRAGKFVAKNLPKVEKVLSERPRIAAMVTLTVRNGPDLQERYNHLRRAYKRLNQRRRDALKGRTSTEWAKVAGAITSYEFTKRGEETGWHPHIHALVLLNDYIDQAKLSEEWHAITGDSFVVDIRKITAKPSAGGVDIASGLLEVCKYALKFADLSLEDTWHAYTVLKGRRLVDCFGVLRGIVIPDDLLDDPLEGLPYIERHYQYSSTAQAYSLVKTVQPYAPSALSA